MQLSSLPARIAAIFAASAAPTSKNTIPLTQAGIAQPGQASFDIGFPAVTMQPASSGGINPYGQDFNGLGNVVTAVQQWQSAGGFFPFDATFSAAVGGYPKGAILLRADGTGLWQNRADNNTVNPDTVGTNWIALAPGWTDGVDTGAANACVVAYTPSVLYLKDGMVLWFKAAATNTGATTLNVNGLGASPVVGAAHSALQGGEIIANGRCMVIWNATLTSWVLIECTGGALQVAAGAQSNQAVNLGQFVASLAASGYVKIPVISGGVLKNWIVQAGVAPATTGGSAVTFPLTFPTNVMGVFTGQNNSAGQTTNALSVSASGFTFTTSVNSNNYWLAIGY